MVLYDPIQGHQIQIDVVDDLHVGVGLILLEKEPGCTCKDLYIALVSRKHRDNLLRQKGLAAHVRQETVHCGPPQIDFGE
jgi:hypothetical protein